MWQFIIPAALQIGASVINKRSADSQNQTQMAWNNYNTQMGYDVAMQNIASQQAIAAINAQTAMAAGQMQARIIEATSGLNAGIIRQTLQYNDSLLAVELEQMWDATELDLMLLGQERARERGSIEATQAASGVVMGQDSAQEVIIDQRTQEALDAFVIRHGADLKAADIMNTRAQNLWQGELEARKTIWEGKLGALSSRAGASMQAAGIRAQSGIQAAADAQSAEYARFAGQQGAIHQYGYNQQANQNNFVDGLFSAAGTGISGYYTHRTNAAQNQALKSLLAR